MRRNLIRLATSARASVRKSLAGAAGRPKALRRWSELGGSRGAMAALEFALVSAPLLLLLFGFIATNAMFYTWTMMQNNAQYAALMLATGQVTGFSTTGVSCSSSPAATQAEYYACSGLPSWASFTATSAQTCSVPSVSVTLSVNASNASQADVYSLFTGKTLTAQATTMKQGNCP